MPTNDFIGFASAGSANIMSQADYAAAAEQTDGVQPGPASSKLANKIWRQGANMAAAIADIITAQGLDALDNGDIAALASNILAALSLIYLPLAGGQMSGNITKNALNSMLYLSGGQGWDLASNGARLALYGKDETTNPGVFVLGAGSSQGAKTLIGKPDGTMTWDGKDVATVTTGTWTPVLRGGGTAGAFTYSTQKGNYVKIGNLVYIVCDLAISDCITVPTGTLQISGLPFTVDNSFGSRQNGIIARARGFDSGSFRKLNGFLAAGNSTTLMGRMVATDANIGTNSYNEIEWSTTATTGQYVKLAASSYTNTDCCLSGWYLTV